MEMVVIEKVFVRRYKAQLRRRSLIKYNKNLMKLIFEFLDIKEILKCMKVSKMFSKTSLSFQLMEMYIKLIKDKKTSLNALLGNNGMIMNTLLSDSMADMKSNVYSFGELLLEYLMKKEIYTKEINGNKKCFKITNTIGEKGVYYLSSVINKFGLTEIDLTGNKIGNEGMLTVTSKIKEIKSLRVLNVSNNHLTSIGFKILFENLADLNLENLNLACNNIELDGCQYFGEYIHQNNKLKELNLNNNKINPEKIEVIIPALFKHPSLSLLDVSYNDISDEGCRYISEFLKKNKTIKKLDLANNKITQVGCEYIIQGLNLNESMEYLSFGLNRLNHECMKNLADFLSSNETLKILNLKNNLLSAQGAAIISESLSINTGLKCLNLGANSLTDMGLKFILQELCQNNSLELVDFRNNELTDDCCNYLYKFFITNQTLKSIVLSFNEITSKGVFLIAQGLTYNRSLQQLDLNNNHIENEGADSLFNALLNSNCSVLKEINLNQNTIGNDGLLKLPSLIRKNVLISVFLKSNSISMNGIVDLAQAIKDNETILCLDLSYNLLGDEGITLILEAAIKSRSLKFIDVSHNNITSKCKKFVEKLKNEERHLKIIY